MKIKTSVSISSEVLEKLQEYTTDGGRSEFIETAVLSYLEQKKRVARDERDRHILETGAPGLNKEALDTLSYQSLP